jgi:hypothetical protein
MPKHSVLDWGLPSFGAKSERLVTAALQDHQTGCSPPGSKLTVRSYWLAASQIVKEHTCLPPERLFTLSLLAIPNLPSG